jgi:hypothetical protein
MLHAQSSLFLWTVAIETEFRSTHTCIKQNVENGFIEQWVSRPVTGFNQFANFLWRGSKGIGHVHLGARPAYPLECFAVLEEHRDFEHVGFHLHLLVKGVDYVP